MSALPVLASVRQGKWSGRAQRPGSWRGRWTRPARPPTSALPRSRPGRASSTRCGRCRRTVATLRAINPDCIIPAHCTGLNTIFAVHREMPAKLVMPSTGTRVLFGA